MRLITIFLFLLLISLNLGLAQQVNGKFSGHSNQMIYLYRFDQLESKLIDSTITNHDGEFNLKFTANDFGMGYLEPKNQKPLVLVLANETVELIGDASDLSATSNILKGQENITFVNYAKESALRENALSAWTYLNKMYSQEQVFKPQKGTSKNIVNEINRIKKEDVDFIASLPANSFLKWYLPIRKLVESVGVVAQYKPEEIPSTLASLRALDMSDERFYKSGILNAAIENHIWFIENSSGDLENVFKDLNESVEIVIKQLKDENEKFNLVTQYWFEVLEKRSLYSSSEYLAKRLLEGDDCGCLNPNFEKQLNQYGKIAIGQTASDIKFGEYTYFPNNQKSESMKALGASYYLIVFSASWCGHCREAMPKISAMSNEFVDKNIATVMVSLDTDVNEFVKFSAPLPFVSTTDLKKWDSPAAIDYQIYATPTYFMLDKNLKILMKFKSVEHIKAWIDIVN